MHKGGSRPQARSVMVPGFRTKGLGLMDVRFLGLWGSGSSVGCKGSVLARLSGA